MVTCSIEDWVAPSSRGVSSITLGRFGLPQAGADGLDYFSEPVAAI